MCADPNSVLRLSFEQAGPSYTEGLLQSRQLRGTMPDRVIGWATLPLTVAGLILLLPLLYLAWRKRDVDAATLLAAVVVALVLNALLAGALSDVHARYQSRIAWLAPFAVLAVLLRWKSLRGRTADTSPAAAQIVTYPNETLPAR